MDYGTLSLNIDCVLRERGISKNRICKDLDIPRTNFNRYCRNSFQRIDALLLCKLCWYLDVAPGDLLAYKRPEPEQNGQEEA